MPAWNCPARALELTPAPRRLRAALAAALVPTHAPEIALFRRWLDTWTGLGLVAAGMHRAGWDLQLTQYGTGHGGAGCRTAPKALRKASRDG